MRFTILQQDIWPAVQAVSRSCGVRSQLPVLGNILVRAEKDSVQLLATNLEVGVIKGVRAQIGEEGEVTVPSRTLLEVVSNLSGEKLELSATNDQLQIATPSFSSKMNGIPAAEFPTIPLIGKEAVAIKPEVLAKTLPQVTFAAAVDDGRPVLTGILTEIKNKKLELVATDGYKLARKTVPIEEDATFKALVPRRTFEEVMRLISEEGPDVIKISTSDDQNQIIFDFGNTQLSSRLIEGQFPAWEKIVPTKALARIIADRADLLKAVKLASVFARNEANVVKIQNLPGKLNLTSEAKELGSQKKEIEAQSEGEEIEIAFNTKFLQDVLGAFSATQVILELSGSLSAASIKPMGEDSLEYIVMPVNLS